MRNRKDRLTPLGVGLLAAIAGLVGLIVWRANQAPVVLDTLQAIQTTGVVRIGYANEAPYGYLDSKTGRITGEAPEIARVILRQMGATRIEAVVTEFGSLIPGLKAGRFDLIAAGMYITPQRAQEINFSNPTYSIGETFLVAAGNPLDLHSFDDVADSSSARIGVMGGSVEHGYAKDSGVPDDRIIVFPDYASAVGGLSTGRIDAMAATTLTAGDLLRKYGGDRIEIAKPFHDPVVNGTPTRGYGAFGFRKRDTAFLEEFNRQLNDFIGTPSHLELVQPFGFSDETLPGDATAEQVVNQMQK